MSGSFARRLLEAEPQRMIPYAGHIRPRIVALFDGTAMAMFRLPGSPFELEPNAVRNGREERFNTLLRAIADSDLSIDIHLVHHKHATPAPQPRSTNRFVARLMRSYQRVALDGLFQNDWFISVMLHPPSQTARSVRDAMMPWRKSSVLTLDGEKEQALEDACHLIETTLASHGIQRLGLAEWETNDGWMVPETEIGSALALIMNCRAERVPHTWGPLASAVYREPAVFGTRHFEVGGQMGAMISFLNYPARCRAGMFNELLTADYPFVMTHRFRFRSSGQALWSLGLTRRQMRNAGDAAADLLEGITEAMNKTASMKRAPGLHHFGLAVYAADRASLNVAATDAMKLLQANGGAAPTRERNLWYDGAMEAAYYAQLPGSRNFKPRPGTITSLDLAAMCSLDNYPVGKREGYWGPSPIRFRTNGHTAYDYVTHDEDVGHTLVIGRTGSGKTVLLATVMASLEPVMGADGIRLMIDKDESHRPSIEAQGGVYQRLLRNRPSGLAPLKAYDDSPRNIAFLRRLYTWLIAHDGRRSLTSKEDERLVRGITRQLEMPAELRSMTGVREFLGYEDPENGAGARFERYCRGGSMGWLLDNDEHVISVGAGLYGFDFTDLIPREGTSDDGSCSVAAAVIMHQLGELMDGRRICAWFEECRFYLGPLQEWIEDITLTGRKKEVACGLVFQQPEHVTESAIGLSIVAQMRTKLIFPDTNHNHEALRRLQLSEAAIALLKGGMTLGRARRFLLWRDNGAVICEFDLTGMEELPQLGWRARAEKEGVYREFKEEMEIC